MKILDCSIKELNNVKFVSLILKNFIGDNLSLKYFLSNIDFASKILSML